jgi:hypothetical protein
VGHSGTGFTVIQSGPTQIPLRARRGAEDAARF